MKSAAKKARKLDERRAEQAIRNAERAERDPRGVVLEGRYPGVPEDLQGVAHTLNRGGPL